MARRRAGKRIVGGELDFRLVRGAAIDGIVTDAEGNPLAGTLVFAAPHYDVRVQSTGVAAFTNAEGHYRVAYVPRDRTVFITATASQAGFSTKHESVRSSQRRTGLISAWSSVRAA